MRLSFTFGRAGQRIQRSRDDAKPANVMRKTSEASPPSMAINLGVVIFAVCMTLLRNKRLQTHLMKTRNGLYIRAKHHRRLLGLLHLFFGGLLPWLWPYWHFQHFATNSAPISVSCTTIISHTWTQVTRVNLEFKLNTATHLSCRYGDCELLITK